LFKLASALASVFFKTVENYYPRDINEQMENFSNFYVDESVPRLYDNSRISSDQLPGHNINIFSLSKKSTD
jgi:transcription elongation factor SPT6